jgi:hypothetical protein
MNSFLCDGVWTYEHLITDYSLKMLIIIKQNVLIVTEDVEIYEEK